MCTACTCTGYFFSLEVLKVSKSRFSWSKSLVALVNFHSVWRHWEFHNSMGKYIPRKYKYYLECCSSKYLNLWRYLNLLMFLAHMLGIFLQYYQSLTFVKAIFFEDVFVYPPKRSWSECLSNTRCLAKNNHYLSTITQSFKLKSSNYSGKGMEIKKMSEWISTEGHRQIIKWTAGA